MKEITVEELKKNIAELIKNISNEDERFLITEKGQPVAGLVSLGDVETILELEGLAADVEKHQELKDILGGMIGIDDE